MRGQDLGFHDEGEGVKKLAVYIEQHLNDGKVHVGVLVQRPYSVAVAVRNGTAAVFDSHAHDAAGSQRGAVLAVAGKGCNVQDMASYIAGFSGRMFRVRVADTHFCLLEKKPEKK